MAAKQGKTKGPDSDEMLVKRFLIPRFSINGNE